MPPKAGSQTFLASTQNAQNFQVPGSDGNLYPITTRQYAPGTTPLSLDDPFLANTGGAATVRPVSVLYTPPDQHDGDVWKWSFDVQRELPHNMALTVGYAGSKGTHIGNSITNFNDPFTLSGTFRQENRPYPEFFDNANPELGVQGVSRIRYIDTFGESFYHGLQVKLDKRYSSGLTFGLAYTWSKAHGDGENGGQEGASWQNTLDRRGSRGLFRFDQTHKPRRELRLGNAGQEPAGHSGSTFWAIGSPTGLLSLRSGFPYRTHGASRRPRFGERERSAQLSPAEAELSDPTREVDGTTLRRSSARLAASPPARTYALTAISAITRCAGRARQQFDFSLYQELPNRPSAIACSFDGKRLTSSTRRSSAIPAASTSPAPTNSRRTARATERSAVCARRCASCSSV